MNSFADLHCHPGSPAYDETRLSSGSPQGDKQPFHPWHIPSSNLKRQAKARRAFGYSQSDLAKSTASQATLLFAALYPTEKGFFFGIKNGRTRADILALHARLRNSRASGTEDEETTAAYQQLTPTERQEFSKRTAVDELQSNKMNYSVQRVQFIQSGNYDYYEELKHEYNFWLALDAQQGSTTRPLALVPGDSETIRTGKYQLADPANLTTLFTSGVSDRVVVIVTIEGMHALGTGNHDWENVKDVTQEVLLKRIEELKDKKKWKHRPFFITFSHHFNNRLCGHAHSLPAFSRKLLFDQNEMLDTGFTEQGLEAARALLGLDELLHPNGSARILVDVKHMSAQGRLEFYRHIIRPFNARPENAHQKIPVVASHIGFSGAASLQFLIDHAHAEKDNAKLNGFYRWNINLSVEDVIEIHNSGGLMGISFDQRILGLDKVLGAFSIQDFLKGRRKRTREARQAILRTIEGIVRVPFENALADPHLIWSELAIGTDFDGFIDPVFGYATVMDFPDFEKDLVEALEDLRGRCPDWFAALTPTQAARQICYDNARDFLLKHYR